MLHYYCIMSLCTPTHVHFVHGLFSYNTRPVETKDRMLLVHVYTCEVFSGVVYCYKQAFS